MSNRLNEDDKKYLQQCLKLAAEAVEAGDEAFGSILVNAKGEIIAEARNRVNEINVLAHPEIELTKWAVENLCESDRKKITMYTTGEHCPMCSAAHGWVGLGTIVYLSSAEQLGEWQKQFDRPAPNINFLPVQDIIKNLIFRGPGEGVLLEEIKKLHEKSWVKINLKL